MNNTNKHPIFAPTLWQAVIFRNFGLVNIELLAKTLSCSVNIIKKEAKRLGIDHITFNPLWRERSYITIIRNNWSILPTDQIITLLDMTKEQLDFELKENDFLDVKLGKKPYCEKVKYSPLNEEEKRITSSIKRVIRKSFIEEYKQPFSFDYLEVSNNINNSNLRIVYPYSAPYGDALINSFDIVNENELIAMQKAGINGIWIQGLLSELSHYPFDGKNDEKFKIRRENLRKFIAKAQNFGIGVYLYFNEPRSININKISSEFKHLIGRVEEDQAALCISQKEIQDYLYLSTKDLLDEVPEISGIMTITSSENLTHCKHKPGSNCTKCSDYKPYELAALINNIIFSAAKESKSNAKIIANLWGWADYCDYTQSDIKKGIKLLNKDITVMCVSEFGTHKKGKERYIIDEYSISHGEPCLETVSNLKTASNLGHKVMAKLQVNTSWEMPTIPYLPVFENVVNHLEKLRKLNVNDYFASWTLGGYPSVTMNLLSSFNDDFNYDQWLKEIYKNNSEKIKKAVHYFSKGFSYLPFEQNTLYFSPIGLGPISPLFIKKTDFDATMVTFPYDDIDKWINKDNAETSLEKYRKLLSNWKKGLRILKEVENTQFIKELKDVSFAFYYNVVSFINQYNYYSGRIDVSSFKKTELKSLLGLYKIAPSNSSIGFEASNHYMYTQNLFLEKLVALKQIK